MTSEKNPGKFPGKIPGKRPEEIPIPSCKNTNRRTAKGRRMCCARKAERVSEADASGQQTKFDGNFGLFVDKHQPTLPFGGWKD